MKNILLSIALLITAPFLAQNEPKAIDDMYIIVPESFEFFGKKDEHRLNTLTRYLLKQNGFNAIYAKEVPSFDRCNVLYADVLDSSGLIRTKTTVVLKDCYGEIVASAAEGSSKEKNHEKAYQEAIRESMLGFMAEGMTYISASTSTNLNTPSVLSEVTDTPLTTIEKPQEGILINEPQIPVKKESELDTSTPSIATYTFEDLTIDENGADVKLIYNGKLIGKLIPTSNNTVYLVEATMFTGVAFKKENSFIIERKIEGMSQPVIMNFKKN